MPEPGKSDKWNSLLETLGVPATEPPAKPPEAAAEPPKAAAAPPPRSAKPAPKPKSTPPAAKSPSYWSRIAGALGLESAPEPEPEPAPPPPPPAPVAERPARGQESGGRGREVPPERSAPPPRKLESMFGPKEPDIDVFALDQGSDRSADEPPRQPVHREPPPSRREPPPSRREPPPGRREPPAGRSEPPGRREPPPGREAPPPAFSAEDDEGFVLDYEVEGDSDLHLGEEPVAPVSEVSDDDSDRGGPPLGERSGGVGGPRRESAGGLRGDSEDGPREGGRRRRGRRRGRGRGGRRDEGPPPAASPSAPRFEDREDLEEYGPPAEAEFEREPEFELDEGSDLDLGADMPPAARGSEGDDRLPPRRPQRSESAGGPRDDEGGRSRRGRRGGRGRGRDQDRDRDRPPAGPRPTDYGPGQRDERLADDLPIDDEAADIELSGEPEGDEGPASGHPTHKKIPTWEEAVGILIEANMAARADRPDRDRGRGGGGGGGGGRGRGGRGRGGGGGRR